MDIYELIRKRKSVRAFTDEPVTDEKIRRILETARLAPSANNKQEWRFITVRDPEMRSKLAEAARGQTFVGEAPVVLVCCAQTDNHVMTCFQSCYPIDLAIAIDHITLCAVEEGLGTCWIGAFFENQVKELLGIPAHIRVVALLPVGVPQDPAETEKKRLDYDIIVKTETWS